MPYGSHGFSGSTSSISMSVSPMSSFRRALLAATIECLVGDLGVTRDDAVISRQACPRWVRKVPAVSFLDLAKEEDEIVKTQ